MKKPLLTYSKYEINHVVCCTCGSTMVWNENYDYGCTGCGRVSVYHDWSDQDMTEEKRVDIVCRLLGKQSDNYNKQDIVKQIKNDSILTKNQKIDMLAALV